VVAGSIRRHGHRVPEPKKSFASRYWNPGRREARIPRPRSNIDAARRLETMPPDETTPGPRNGFLHQQTGGPALCGQQRISTDTPSNCCIRAEPVSASRGLPFASRSLGSRMQPCRWVARDATWRQSGVFWGS
jgi:hypothetical protein